MTSQVSQSPLVTIASTLAIVALFHPLRSAVTKAHGLGPALRSEH